MLSMLERRKGEKNGNLYVPIPLKLVIDRGALLERRLVCWILNNWRNEPARDAGEQNRLTLVGSIQLEAQSIMILGEMHLLEMQSIMIP